MIRHAFLLAATAALLPGAAAAPPQAASGPGVVRQTPAPPIYRFAVGKARVTALSDGTVAIDLHQLLHGITVPQMNAALARSFSRNPFEASINAYLIELDGRKILVDTGSGELFGPNNGGRLPEALAIAGVRPEEITDILITHVHTDHSGGLVLGGRIMFPRATIHAGKADVDFFLDPAKTGIGGYEPRLWSEAAKTFKPYVDAGKVRAFDRTGPILPGIVAELKPGHTPGSAFYTLTSAGRRITFIGDIVHAGPVQLPQPDVTIKFDQDEAKARAVRRAAFAAFARERTLVAAPHLSFPGVGHVQADGRGYRWHPVEHGDRADEGDALKL